MQFPTIHNNGSDPARLIEDFLDASEVLREALDLMEGSCGPCARDYFDKQPTANFEAASAEHTARLQAIIKVRGELLSLADNVQKQVDEIAAARLVHRAEFAMNKG
jgi:hypothetical protein